MKVLFEIGDYGKDTFALDMKDAVKVLEILTDAGISYVGDGVYEPKNILLSINNKPFTMKAIPPVLPIQLEDPINEI